MIRAIACVISLTATSLCHGDEASHITETITGSISAVYSAPDSAWFSIYASPSKFQRLTPTILLIDTGDKIVHVHALKAEGGLIPAEYIAVAGRPGTYRAPDPVRLQIASSSMPQIGSNYTIETFKVADGLIYGVNGTLRSIDPKLK